MKHLFLLALGAGLLGCVQVLSQPVTVWQSGLIENLLESVESKKGELADYETLLHELENLQRHPIDLNTAAREDLQKLFFLTDFQISAFLDYRAEHGALLSLNELTVIPGFNDETRQMMFPFVTIGAKNQVAEIKSNRAQHEIVLRTQHVFEPSAGYENDSASGRKYPGNRWLYYGRYGLEISSHVGAGITVEKDPGEEFFAGENSTGFDFYSAYARVSDYGILKNAVAGDFRLQFGQGLTLWSGSAPGKSVLSMNIIRRQDGIKPYVSSDENDHFRGVAATGSAGNFTLSLFYSTLLRDANITDTLSSGEICFSSFQETGYHRTPSENTDEKSVREASFGGNLHFRNNWLKAGTTFAGYRFDKYRVKGSDPEDAYAFEGKSLWNWGMDFTATLKKWQLFGETSHGYRGWATLDGILYNVNKYASLSLLYRNFQPGFYSLHASAFSEGSSNNNEEGFYAGTVLHPFANWQVSAYADFYHFPWLRYRTDAPSSGQDYMAEVDFAPGKRTDMFFRVHYEENPENESIASVIIPRVTAVKRTGLRYHISWPLTSRISMQNRIEAVWVKKEGSASDKGIMIYQGIGYQPVLLPLSLDLRIAWFNTGSYDSRMYAYEQDLSTGFSFAPLFNSGYRTYVMVRYEITPAISLRVRLSRIQYADMVVISSGPDQINGSGKTELKIQVSARF